jgi:hypothetical protein
MADGGFMWLASYPKSGNTWLRCLVEAYRTNGYLDINDMRSSIGDSGKILTDSVSPVATHELTEIELYLLRPAALLQTLVYAKTPRFIKTHFCNKQPNGASPFIPACWTDRAIYIMRDPRSVAVSFARHFGFSSYKTIRGLNNQQLSIGGDASKDTHSLTIVGDWSSHVESWTQEKQYPVLILRYEDLLANTEAAFKMLIEFCGLEYDEARAKRAIRAASLKSLQKAEATDGFGEVSKQSDKFFTEGGTRWEQELGPKWVRQIEKDHQKTMKKWGYL